MTTKPQVKCRILTLLTFFITIFGFSQNSIEEVDNLAIKINSLKSSSAKIDTYYKIVRGYQNFDLKKAVQYNDSILILSKQINYPKGYAYYYENKAYDLMVTGRKSESVVLLKKAVDLYLKVGDIKGYLSTNWLLAQNYGGLGQEVKMRAVLINALEQVKNTEGKYMKEKAELYQLLSLAYSKINKYQAIRYLNIAISLFKKDNSNDNIGISNCYLTMSNLYINLKKYEKALYYIKLLDENVYKNPEYVYQIYLFEYAKILYGLKRYNEALEKNTLSIKIARKYSIERVVLCQNLFSKIYYSQQQYNKSIEFAKSALKENEIRNELLDDEKFESLKILGNSYYALGKLNEAENYQRLALNFFSSEYGFDVYEDLSKTYYALNDFKKAHAYYKMYAEGEMYSIRKDGDEKFFDSQVQFEVEEKNLQIQRQIQRQNQQKEQLYRNRKVLIITLISLSILFLLLIFLFILYKKNKKKNKIIEKKNKILIESEILLNKALSHKNILLKEVYHRVKNNLQLVMSILRMQASKSKNHEVQEFVKKSQLRINAISLIHQNLYQSIDLEKISFKNYVNQLILNIKQTLDRDLYNIDFVIDVEEVFFDIDILIPLGLIINEAVSNSIKYAFPNHEDGIISIKLTKDATNSYSLYLADNGKGMIEDFGNKTSLGILLIKQLVSQVNGELDIIKSEGVVLNIKFSN